MPVQSMTPEQVRQKQSDPGTKVYDYSFEEERDAWDAMCARKVVDEIHALHRASAGSAGDVPASAQDARQRLEFTDLHRRFMDQHPKLASLLLDPATLSDSRRMMMMHAMLDTMFKRQYEGMSESDAKAHLTEQTLPMMLRQRTDDSGGATISEEGGDSD